MPKIEDVALHTIDNFEPGDVIEFIHPVSGKFAVGKFVKVIKRRKGNRHTDIELENISGKVIITEKNIRWDCTIYHKNKNLGSETKCNYQTKLSTL